MEEYCSIQYAEIWEDHAVNITCTQVRQTKVTMTFKEISGKSSQFFTVHLK